MVIRFVSNWWLRLFGRRKLVVVTRNSEDLAHVFFRGSNHDDETLSASTMSPSGLSPLSVEAFQGVPSVDEEAEFVLVEHDNNTSSSDTPEVGASFGRAFVTIQSD